MSALWVLILAAMTLTVRSQSTVRGGMTSYQHYCKTDSRCQYMVTLPDCGNEKDCNSKEDQPMLTQLMDIVMQLSDQMNNQMTQQNDQISTLNDQISTQNDQISTLNDQMTQQNDQIRNLTNDIHQLNVKRDCDSVRNAIGGNSGVYQIQPIGALPFDVYCEMTESGAWTVIQRRQDGSVIFTRNWDDYKSGFGNINGEYWMGNDNIYRLTNQASYKMRIDLEKFDGSSAYADYDLFWIEDEYNNYTLHLGQYSGTAGDAMRYVSGNSIEGQPFSTYDRDNDNSSGNCASSMHSGWWFSVCGYARLNGLYYPQEEYHPDGIIWHTWNIWYTLKSSTMKIRKID